MISLKHKTLLLFTLVSLNFSLEAQIITTEPALPLANTSVTIFYNATLGTAGLKDYTGDVYAHTGVLTEKSSGNTDWKYVKTDWGENTPETKLSRISANLYSLEITPAIRSYYAVPENEAITHMAFVFRSADNALEGKGDNGADIFVQVFEAGLNVSIIQPTKDILINSNTDLNFEAAASESADLQLLLNSDLVTSKTGTELSYTFNFDTPGDYWLKISASSLDEYDEDSVFVHVLGMQEEELLPEGLKNGINYMNDQTVQLVLHAPGKEHVFVVGDFNSWTPGTEYRMKKDDEHWWISISNLVPGTEYAFQYLVDGDLLIADPYTEKVLDPTNDKWISDATYPDLKEYPSGLTSGITSVLQTGQEAYSWKNSSFNPPDKENLVIYELLVRDFVDAHDWKTLTDTLNYFSSLGISAIELLPFNEFEGNESWGYNPSFYFAPDKYYGPKKDLQVFIDSCHGRGIAVIMDMTLNHSFSQSPLVQLYFNNSTYKVTSENPWYNVDSPNPVFAWGYDFNHEAQETKDFVDRVNSHWLTEYDIDGFRFDFTKGFTNTPGDGGAYDAARIAILKRMASAVWNVNPDAYVIFEHLADNSEEKNLSAYGIMLWGNINYNYNEATMGWNDGGKSDFSWISYKKRSWTDPHLVGYMESHDEERLMFKNLSYGNAYDTYNIQNLNTALARQELAGVFFFTIPGPKMIWQFGELGYDFSIDYNGRVGNKPIRWDYNEVSKRKKLYQIYSALINLKKSEPAFSSEDFTLNLSSSTKTIEINHDDMDVRILGNFDVEWKTMDPNFSKTGIWYEYFSGESINVKNLNNVLYLNAGEYRLYTTKKLDPPEITVNIPSPGRTNTELTIYPVPATQILYFDSPDQIKHITVFDVNGKVVIQEDINPSERSVDIAALNSGFYFLEARLNNGSIARSKFLKTQ